MNSAEDQLGVFAQYYGLPQLSLRNVIWHQTEGGLEHYGLKDIMLDGGGDIHPNERGHACVPPSFTFCDKEGVSIFPLPTFLPLPSYFIFSIRPSYQ